MEEDGTLPVSVAEVETKDENLNVGDEEESSVQSSNLDSELEIKREDVEAQTQETNMKVGEQEEEDEEDEGYDEKGDEYGSSRVVTALEQLKSGGDLRKPLEELIEQTISENPIYNTREELLNTEDPHALIFLGKTISAHAKQMKSHFLRRRKEKESEESTFQWSNNQITMVYINFHSSSIDKFLLASTLDPLKSFDDINPSSNIPESKKKKEKGKRFPTMELCYEWGLASLRYGKALESQNDCHAAYSQYDIAAKLFLRVIQEDRRRKWTAKVMNKIVIVFECMAKVKPTSSEVRNYCELFLVQFSNIAMRGEMKEMSLKPLIAMVLTESRYVREACAIDVIRHLATYFKSNVASEASEQLSHLESVIEQSKDGEMKLKSLPTAALKRLAVSGLKREEYIEHIEALINILQWKGKPPCRLSFNYTRHGDTIDGWSTEDPKKIYTGKHKLTNKEKIRNSYVFIARRKKDKVPVTVKVFLKWSENQKNIKKEIALLGFLNQHDNFTKLLNVILHNDEVWAIVEYCDAGNLVDLIPITELSEPEMAYIIREVLQALQFLHSENRMHRDLTTDDILINSSGDIMLSDFELWMGNNLQRFWLPPELLLCEPYPFGPEVDIWSLGCILIEMAEGSPPYSDLHPIKEFFFTATVGAPPLKKPRKWSSDFKTFLEGCLNVDPSRRMTADQLLSHPWLEKAITKQEFAETVPVRMYWSR